MAIAALLVLATCVLLVIYPFVIYPAILSRMPRARPPAADARPDLRYALLFCAFNEEKALPETIANLRRIRTVWPQLRIMAYSDCSSDRTFEILSQADDVLEAIDGKERAGKPAGMRKLVERTDADIVIFMDANVLIDPATIRRFETYFADPQIGCVAGSLHYINEGESSVAAVGALYWRLEERIKRLESETGSTMGADGSLFAMRRAFYPEVREDLQDDFLASMQVLFHDLRCVSAADILAYEKAATNSSSEFRRKRRIACGAFSTHRYMWPRVRRLPALDRFKYVSHKLIRWFGAVFIAIGAIAAAVLASELGMLGWYVAAGLVVILAGVIGTRLGISPVSKVVSILTAMVATSMGVFESLLGGRYAVWNPVDR
jgi:cellulose synthase/poly-beta-1,6-N-acetylglucosamine synthase-like glycosyltransferase